MAYFPLVFKINLIANDQEGERVDVLRLALRQEDLLPVHNVIETLRICYIVYETTAVCSTVES